MKYWFERDAEGYVHARVGADLPTLQMVLEDGLHPSPPTDATLPARCTHYVNHALDELLVDVPPGERHQIIGGNMTYVENRGGQLYANVDYQEDTGAGDLFPLREFFTMLVDYREQIRASCRAGTCPTCRPPR